MKIDNETRKYIHLLIRLRRIADELEKLSEFELALLASELNVSEDELRCFAHSDNLRGDGRGE